MASQKLTVASLEPVDLDDNNSKKNLEVSPVVSDIAEPASTPVSVPATTVEDKQADKAPESKTESKKESSKETLPVSNKSTEKSESIVEDAPPKPKRPLSPLAQKKKDLCDAFPQIEEKYIHACLIASGGNPDPAFNALLYLLDPSYEPEIVSVEPPKAPLPPVALTDDELLARQLQKEFDKEERKRRIQATQRQRKSVQHQPEEDSPDEFEQLKESFTQGFEEAKLTLNNWVSGISKNFSGDNNASQNKGGNSNNLSPALFGALGGSSFNKNNQRNKNFDDDPEILSLNFQRNLDMRDLAPPLPQKPKTDAKSTKWQPLNSDVPMSSDAFLVTDSEDEDKTGKKL